MKNSAVYHFYSGWGETHEKQCSLSLKLYLRLYIGNINLHT